MCDEINATCPEYSVVEENDPIIGKFEELPNEEGDETILRGIRIIPLRRKHTETSSP